MKKLIIIIMSLIYFSILFSQVEEIPLGDGSVGNPYQISVLNHLYWLSNHQEHWDKHFIQTADIDASETQNWNDIGTTTNVKEGFLPIGDINNNFTGYYNGQNYSINHLMINRSNLQGVGFFGFIKNATICNIKIFYSNIIGSVYVGSLVGQSSYSEVLNCCVSGVISGNSIIGGLLGVVYNSTISNSYSYSNINALNKFGGLIGENHYSNYVSNSYYNYETVLINNQHLISKGALSNDLFIAWINSNLNLNIMDYYNQDNYGNYIINSTNDFRNLLYFGHSDHDFILNQDIDLSAFNNFYIYEFQGRFDGNNHIISGLNINDTLSVNVGLFGIVRSSEMKNINLNNTTIATRRESGGLAGKAENSSFINCHINVNISGYSEIGGIIGIADSLFIENCSTSGMIFSKSSGGGIVGKLDYPSTINNCHNYANISGNGSSGGIVCYSSSSLDEINNCTNSGNISSSSTVLYIGGIVGSSFGKISHCENTGNIDGGKALGGICGSAYSNITFCTNYGTLNQLRLNKGSVGGISGYHGNMKHISFCTNEGEIYYNHNNIEGGSIGGIVGENGNSYVRYCINKGLIKGISSINSRIGGLVGINNNSSIIKRSFNLGTIIDTTNFSSYYQSRSLGGISGSNRYFSIIEDCFNKGDIQLFHTSNYGLMYHGAIAGINNYYSLIINTYNIGTINSVTNLPSFVYTNDASAVRHSFWDSDITELNPGINDNGTIEDVQGLSSEQMKDINTYTSAGWDFENIWQIAPNTNDGYPFLIWDNDPLIIDHEEIPNASLNQPVLYSAYPNPFNPSTTISFELKQADDVTIDIYNIKGQKVKSLLQGHKEIGYHSIVWNGTNDNGSHCSSGIYFYVLKTSQNRQSKKMVLAK